MCLYMYAVAMLYECVNVMCEDPTCQFSLNLDNTRVFTLHIVLNSALTQTQYLVLNIRRYAFEENKNNVVLCFLCLFPD